MPRAVVFAYHDVGAMGLEHLLESGFEVPLVVTHDDPTEGSWFASVGRLAAARGIPTVTPTDPNTREVADRLRALAPEFVFSFYYRHLLSPALLRTARTAALNLHGSLLPRYRGRAPVNWAVIRGETETGATLHHMVARADAGDIVDQLRVPIGADDRAIDVLHKVCAAGREILRRALPRLLDGTASRTPQDPSRATYFGRRRPEDGRIDWSRSASEVHNLVRGVAPPFPGAFTELPQGTMIILRTRPEPERSRRFPSPTLFCERGAWYAQCGDGSVVALLEIEAEGKLCELPLPISSGR